MEKPLRHVICVYPFRTEVGPRDHCFPPLGLEVVAGQVARYAEKVDVIDLRHERKSPNEFLTPETDLVCFSVNWNIERSEIRDRIRSIPPHIRTVLGGQYPSRDPQWWLTQCPNLDCVVRGDGHVTIGEIACATSLEGIAGITYRSNGHFVDTPPREYTPLGDDFHPKRSLRRHRYELLAPTLNTGIWFDTVASSLGCPFNCTFCSFNRDAWGRKRPYMKRSPESVVQELSEIDADIVAFVDLDFTHDADRVARICDLIIERGIEKRLVCNSRVEIARRPDVLEKMQRAGFSVMLIGVESAQDKSLLKMKKGFTTAQARKYFAALKRTSIMLHATFIVGYFGEDERDMRAIVPYARELGIDTVNLCLFRNQAGAGLEKLVAETPGYHIAEDGNIYSDQFSAERLAQMRARMFREFYDAKQIIRLIRKGFKNKLLRFGLIPRLAGYAARAAMSRFDPSTIGELKEAARADFATQMEQMDPAPRADQMRQAAQ